PQAGSKRPIRCSRAWRFPDAEFETTFAAGLEHAVAARPAGARALVRIEVRGRAVAPRTGGLKARTSWAMPMKNSGRTVRPGKQGLYDPWYEHDACGVGFVVDMKGRKSHRILAQAIEVLRNLDHRGACGCEANTGDGAGVLLQMPHGFFKEIARKARLPALEPGAYGTGLVFLPRSPAKRRRLEEHFEHIVQSEG